MSNETKEIIRSTVAAKCTWNGVLVSERRNIDDSRDKESHLGGGEKMSSRCVFCVGIIHAVPSCTVLPVVTSGKNGATTELEVGRESSLCSFHRERPIDRSDDAKSEASRSSGHINIHGGEPPYRCYREILKINSKYSHDKCALCGANNLYSRVVRN